MSTASPNTAFDLVCFSHLRWDFVFQRPQHLLSRCAKERRVFFFEEPIFGEQAPRLDVSDRPEGVKVVVPHLPHGLSPAELDSGQRRLVDELFAKYEIETYAIWYYTPMSLSFTDHLKPVAVVYDAMDELSAFRGAPPALREREQQLYRLADLVFTGGKTLYEAKKNQHHSVYAFPSSIDVAHFAKARTVLIEPGDQADIPHPRLGFYGVVDERFDVPLLAGLAELRPDWHFVIIGPVVKIDEGDLPRAGNIHYLGGKKYDQLPEYLAGWDVALLLFARNESTRYISPTKTPEYLAAGKPVVSTSITDVITPYGDEGLVKIADAPADVVAAAEELLASDEDARIAQSDAFLADISWDKTWRQMADLIAEAVASNNTRRETREPAGVA